jgi:hypothetical protein
MTEGSHRIAHRDREGPPIIGELVLIIMSVAIPLVIPLAASFWSHARGITHPDHFPSWQRAAVNPSSER